MTTSPPQSRHLAAQPLDFDLQCYIVHVNILVLRFGGSTCCAKIVCQIAEATQTIYRNSRDQALLSCCFPFARIYISLETILFALLEDVKTALDRYCTSCDNVPVRTWSEEDRIESDAARLHQSLCE